MVKKLSEQELNGIEQTIDIARGVIAGHIDPNKGCTLISEIGRELQYPEAFQIFEAIDHDQYGHEHLGFDAKSLIPEIIEECKKFISQYSHLERKQRNTGNEI